LRNRRVQQIARGKLEAQVRACEKVAKALQEFLFVVDGAIAAEERKQADAGFLSHLRGDQSGV
jgi:hypothetical protein